MGIFDIFTGDSAKKAAQQQRNYLSGIMNQNDLRLQQAQEQGLAALQGGQGAGLDAIRAAFAQARGDVSGGMDPAIAALLRGEATATGALRGAQPEALAQLQGGVDRAAGAFDPLRGAAGRYGQFGGDAATMLSNALGLRGQAGTDAARAAFQAGPGYDFQVGQGIDAITRAAAAGGQAAGGNVLRESQKFGQGTANQEYQNYLKNLSGVSQLYSPLEAQALAAAGQGQGQAYLTGGTGGANIVTGTGQRLADLASSTGGKVADVYGTGSGRLADLARAGGLAEAGLQTGGGSSIANLLAQLAQTGVQGNLGLAQPYAGTYGTEAAAENQASKNIFNLLGGLGSFGAGGGFGNLISGVGKAGTAAKGLFG
jgi:hypothetical protein